MKLFVAIALALGLLTAPALADHDNGDLMACGEGLTFEETVEAIQTDDMPGLFLVLEGEALKVFSNAVLGEGGMPDEYLTKGQVIIPAAPDENGMHVVINFNKDEGGCPLAVGNGSIPMDYAVVGFKALADAGISVPEIE